jgi:flagellum-specific ATP synthase
VESAQAHLRRSNDRQLSGRVTSVRGLVVDVTGLADAAAIGDRAVLVPNIGSPIAAEVIGFTQDRVEMMTYHPADGLVGGMPVNLLSRRQSSLYPSRHWLGRVMDPLGIPIDDQGPMLQGPMAMASRASPPGAHA